MDDTFDELVIDVRASTQNFAADLEAAKGLVDTTLVDGFNRAGNTIERSLLSALRRGSLGFDDLKRVALRSLDEIASHALTAGFGSLFGNQKGGLGGLLGQFSWGFARSARASNWWAGFSGTRLCCGGKRAGAVRPDKRGAHRTQ